MASNLIDLINEYYEAKKPYNQQLRDSRTDPPSQSSSPETNSSTSHDTQEPQFSLSPRLPNAEITDLLKKLEAAKIEYAQADKSTVKATPEKKGKAPVGKK